MEFCTTEWIRIGKDHGKLKEQWNVAAIDEHVLVEVTGCPDTAVKRIDAGER